MIIQLPNGRIIEVSVELYLELSDEEISELNGIGVHYTKEYTNPFYNSFSQELTTTIVEIEFGEDFDPDEYEPSLDEIEEEEKRMDRDYFPDDMD